MMIVVRRAPLNLFFFFNDTATTEIYTLSLHDALPISFQARKASGEVGSVSRASINVSAASPYWRRRSEEHTSELQSRLHLVCRLLLEKKKNRTMRACPNLVRNNIALPSRYHTLSNVAR